MELTTPKLAVSALLIFNIGALSGMAIAPVVIDGLNSVNSPESTNTSIKQPSENSESESQNLEDIEESLEKRIEDSINDGASIYIDIRSLEYSDNNLSMYYTSYEATASDINQHGQMMEVAQSTIDFVESEKLELETVNMTSVDRNGKEHFLQLSYDELKKLARGDITYNDWKEKVEQTSQ